MASKPYPAKTSTRYVRYVAELVGPQFVSLGPTPRQWKDAYKRPWPSHKNANTWALFNIGSALYKAMLVPRSGHDTVWVACEPHWGDAAFQLVDIDLATGERRALYGPVRANGVPFA